MSVYFQLKPSFIPDKLKQFVNATGILFTDEFKTLQWAIPLFSDIDIEMSWKWVQTEYLQLFLDANKNKRGTVKSCVMRMKRMFIENPDVRKHEVIGATKLYLESINDYTYLKQADYFIHKGVGINKTEDLLDWIGVFRKNIVPGEKSIKDLTSEMQ